LPNLIKKYPDLLFLIIGKTHPNLVNTDGERYRNSLLEKVETLELQDHVEFINRFVPLENLLDYLQLTDIYLFTSNNPHQAVSGTFAYALSCGCPIVSTPIPHAVEVLNGDGLFFEFGNSTGLSKQIDRLLNDSNLRHIYRMNGLHNASSTAWQNSAIAHAKLFESLNPKCQITYTYPKLEFRHMRNLTTSTGIIQFSQLNHPDLSSGYTLDDNARALVVMCMHYKQQKNKQCILDMITYLSFVLNCQRPGGEFLNYVDEHKQFTVQNDTVNLEDANGRAIWALGQVIGLNHLLPFDYDFLIEKAEDALNDYLPNSIHVTSPRAMAFIIKGLYYANQTLDRKDIVCLVEHLANRLVKHYRDTSEEKWQWFEKYFTYGNSVLPEALLMAHEMTETKEFKTIAKSSFDFLLTHMSTDTSFRAISNRSWFQKGNDLTEHQWGGQQAIDVAYTILALQLFHTNYPKNGYDAQMKKAFSWFLGNNHLNQSIYNYCTGGCHDGIETHNVNLNQGAESMVSYLLSRLCMEEV
ncbi:MAG TPA: glycosyltransferase, partial [Aquaticitalea sp.]|nr:glycosyltransferase [Aquaticitalea sp.]